MFICIHRLTRACKEDDCPHGVLHDPIKSDGYYCTCGGICMKANLVQYGCMFMDSRLLEYELKEMGFTIVH